MGQAPKRTPQIFPFVGKLFRPFVLSSRAENEGGYTFDFQACVFMNNKGQEMEVDTKTGERRQRDRGDREQIVSQHRHQ